MTTLSEKGHNQACVMRSRRAWPASYGSTPKDFPTDYALLPPGGHNWGVWAAAFAPAIDWIVQYLPAPPAGAKVLPNAPG